MFHIPLRDLFRDDRDPIRSLTVFGLIFFIGSTIGYVCTLSLVAPIPRDATTLVVGRDFMNFWMYGRAAFMPDPSRFYDPEIYNAVLRPLVGADGPWLNWSYPPSIMLIAAPFAQLGYLTALLCWTVLGVSMFVAVARRYHAVDWRLLPVILSPAAFFCLISGQSSFLTAAMLLAIFAMLDRRPIVAGILIGLLTLKPQLGLLFPIMLMASGRWRTFVSAAVTALALAGLTTAIFGPKVWTDYLQIGIPVQNLILTDPKMLAAPFMPTIFWNIRVTGASYGLAMAIQSAGCVLAIAIVFLAYRFHAKADPLVLSALFLACSIFGSPYFQSYDVLTMTFMAVMLLTGAKADARGQLLARLLYWLPILQMAFGHFHLPGPGFIAPAFALFVLRELRAAPHPAPAPA